MDKGKEPANPLKVVDRMIERMRSTQTTYKGQNGYFINEGFIDKAEKHIQELLDQAEDEDLQAELADKDLQIQKLRQGMSVTMAHMEEMKTLLAAGHKRERELSERAEVEAAKAAEMKIRFDGERKDLNDKLTLVKEINKANKQAELKARHGYCGDTAKAAVQAHQESQAQISDLQAALGQINRRMQLVHQEKDAAFKAAAHEKANNAEIQKKYNELLNKKVMAELDEVAPPVKVEVNSKMVSTLLGDKGLSWIQKAAVVADTDIRERIYNLMQSVQGHKNNRQINGFYDLLKLAFDWVKAQSFRTRLILRDWVSRIESDLRAGVLSHLSEYRKMLESIVGDLRRAAAKREKETREKFKQAKSRSFGLDWFWQELTGWASVTKLRMRRAARKFTQSVSRLWNSWFRAPPGRDYSEDFVDETIWETVHHKSSSRGKEKLSEAPPIPMEEGEPTD